MNILKVEYPNINYITYISPKTHREEIGVSAAGMPLLNDVGRDAYMGISDEIVHAGQHEVLNALLWSL